MYQGEEYASRACAMCGAHELEELGDGSCHHQSIVV